MLPHRERARRRAILVVVPPGDEPPLTDYSPDGLDLTLIRWMLSLTPAERLEVLEDHISAVLSIRKLNVGR